MTLEEIYHEYRILRDSEGSLSDSERGKMAVYGQVCHDIMEVDCMLSYRKSSKQSIKKYMQRTIDCYEHSWPLQDDFSIAARAISIDAANKLREVKTLVAF